MKRSFLLIALLAELAGCATIGHKFDMSTADQIKIGVSTKDDVVALLGKPSSVFKNGNGMVVMDYNFVRAAFGSGESQSFTVIIAPDGKVRDTHKFPTNQ